MAAGRLAHRLADEGDRSDEITDHLRACRAGKIGPSPGAGQQADQGRTAGQGSPEIHLEGLEVRDDLVRAFMALYLNTALLYQAPRLTSPRQIGRASSRARVGQNVAAP